MQSTANLNGAPQSDAVVLDNHPRKKAHHLWGWRAARAGVEGAQSAVTTLPRGWKQKKQNSLVDYCDPLRTMYVLEKQDNESFGFEIQTYGLQLSNVTTVEMCTFVCTVHQGSAADCAGLTTGDIILTINGQSIEGLLHHHVVHAVRQSANTLRVETVCGTIMKRIELEKKIASLKKTLRERCDALRTLLVQEARLTRALQVPPDGFTGGGGGRGCPSDSSCWSMATDDSVFGDTFSPSPLSTPGSGGSSGGGTDDDDHGHFFALGFPDRQESRRKIKSSGSFSVRALGRASSSDGSSSSPSPSYWEDGRASSPFGTLPRNRKGSVRRQLLKLIPGLQRSVERDVVEEPGPDAPRSPDRLFGDGGQNQQNGDTSPCS